jgi:flagellar basal-body rod modification protein FlgD
MDQIRSVLSAREKAEITRYNDEFNKTINNGRQPQQNLGKDDFLKILIAQLSYQDPTAPMEDKEFIAQMAQFSSLEQMTSMASDFARLTTMVSDTAASSALGKSVELVIGENVVQGAVKAVTRGDSSQVLVNGTYYDWASVTKVFED